MIKDKDKKILKKFAYNYSGQTEASNIFYNSARPVAIQKLGCTGCLVGSYVTYTVPAEAYLSTLSQLDADNKAQLDVNANGQAYANSNGTCSAPSVAPVAGNNGISNMSFSLQFHNNCTGSNYNFTLSPNTSNLSLTGIPQGNYTVSFSPTTVGTTQYTYRLNGFIQHAISASITTDIGSMANTVIISP